MTHSPERASIERMNSDATAAGYTVREHKPFKPLRKPPQIMLGISGHGELFEAYYELHQVTAFWRFKKGFRHAGVTGDTYRSLKAFREIVFGREGG